MPPFASAKVRWQIAFLGLEPRLNIKYGFNWAGKIERFSKVSKPLCITREYQTASILKPCIADTSSSSCANLFALFPRILSHL